jgi:lysozyme
MEISNNGLRVIREEEGFESCPYRDVTGTWTRGVGETEGIGPASRCISEAEGLVNVKIIFAERYAYAIKDLGKPLNQNQFDALADFIWNCGPGAMEWNVGRSIRAGNYDQAAEELMQYCYSKGVYIPDLARRRARERALFLTPVKQSNPLDVLYPNERKAVERYLAWSKHPHINRNKINKVRKKMENMRGNIWDAAEYGQLKDGHKVKKGWNINNRKARYELLRKYSI